MVLRTLDSCAGLYDCYKNVTGTLNGEYGINFMRSLDLLGLAIITRLNSLLDLNPSRLFLLLKDSHYGAFLPY